MSAKNSSIVSGRQLRAARVPQGGTLNGGGLAFAPPDTGNVAEIIQLPALMERWRQLKPRLCVMAFRYFAIRRPGRARAEGEGKMSELEPTPELPDDTPRCEAAQ